MLVQIMNNTWPGCGEIDIMEYKGNEPNVIHYIIQGVPEEMQMEIKLLLQMLQLNFMYIKLFDPTNIQIFVDETISPKANDNTLPFNKDFSFILMLQWGELGGAIDPAFTQSSMEIDYVRVNQKSKYLFKEIKKVGCFTGL
jgi:hypothetical protein